MKSTPQTLHKEYEHYIIGVTNIYLNHQYNPLVRSWKFMGYRCSACGQSLKYANAANKHNKNCRTLNPKPTKKMQDDDQ